MCVPLGDLAIAALGERAIVCDQHERRRRIARVSEHELVGHRDEGIEEWLVDVSMHVDPLDAAARLPRIVERAVDEVRSRARDVSVTAHVGRVFAAELQRGPDEALRRRLLDRLATFDRSRERDERNSWIADHICDSVMIQVKNLQHAVR